MKTLLLTVGLVAALTSTAAADILTPPALTVLGTNVFAGPTFTVPTDFAATDELSFTVSGIVSLQPSGAFGTNAAGVVVVAGSSPVGASLPNGSTTYGSLLLGNSSIPFVQLFPTNADNGLGSSAPPTSLTISATLGSLFGSGLSAGTVLEFRVSDINTGDNGGQFSISSGGDAAVPEPGAWMLVVSGLAILSAGRARVWR
jgi:hypothetical protein